jgi:hypothetical protein
MDRLLARGSDAPGAGCGAKISYATVSARGHVLAKKRETGRSLTGFRIREERLFSGCCLSA